MAIKNKFYFFSLGVSGVGISGGDRIFIEFARRWCKKVFVKIFTSFEGRRLIESQKLSKNRKLMISVLSNQKFEHSFIFNYVYKVVKGICLGMTIKLDPNFNNFIYSCSEFWMDSLPAFILKIRYPESKWVAAWYQTAPNPIKGYAEGARENTYNFKALLYWLAQLPIKPLVSNFADYILINNESERKQFKKLDQMNKLVVVIGAVDLEKINEWRKKHKINKKIYGAVFQGRFHPQKGVVEMIEIWRKVVVKKPDAVLAMIGDGPLMNDVKNKIKEYKLDKNINLLGYVFDGDLKYKTFSQSKIVVHPALYDSGGMASAEAMAFGIPCVGFNLKAYDSYYPKGMDKVRVGDLDKFADEIIKLIGNTKIRAKLGEKALDMIKSGWSWDHRSKQIFDIINSNI